MAAGGLALVWLVHIRRKKTCPCQGQVFLLGYHREEDQILCTGVDNAMGSAFGAIMTLPRRQCFCFSLAKRFTHTAADIIDFTAGFVLVQADAAPGWNVEAHDFAVRVGIHPGKDGALALVEMRNPHLLHCFPKGRHPISCRCFMVCRFRSAPPRGRGLDQGPIANLPLLLPLQNDI